MACGLLAICPCYTKGIYDLFRSLNFVALQSPCDHPNLLVKVLEEQSRIILRSYGFSMAEVPESAEVLRKLLYYDLVMLMLNMQGLYRYHAV